MIEFLCDQRVDCVRELNDCWLAASFDEGARFRKPADPLYGFPVSEIADTYTFGA